VAALAVSCRGGGDKGSPRQPPLQQVSLPDLSSIEPAAQAQVQERYAALMRRVSTAGLPSADLGAAYGELGQVLMAAEYNDAAEPCFSNALALSPGDGRWAYYLAHVYRRKGDLARAAEYFQRTVRRVPDDIAALWWLGSLQLELGRADEAEPSFAKASSLEPGAWEPLYGLGRAALARKDYAKSVEHLERALAINPQAGPVHYPLGLAYKGLGKNAEAETHLRQRSDTDVSPVDPLMRALDELLDSSVAYHSRGVNAGRAGAWAEAVTYFRKAAALDPTNASVRLDLGVALSRSGQTKEAVEQVQRARQLAPHLAKAHYAAGVLALGTRDRDAVDAFLAALRDDPGLTAAHLAVAHALQRTGRSQEALPHYLEVVARDPADLEARFGSAIALVRLGRYQEAAKQLTEGSTAHPEEARFRHALARLLAAAPDDGVRDGRRARAMVEDLMKVDATIERAETLAMALAENGEFAEAVAWQRHAIAEVQPGDSPEHMQQMRANLRLYESRQPCRTPWRATDPIFYPNPGAALAPSVTPQGR
jgi:tetratricopeptide (TPR) repeat protein